jgi:hypothetical protein
MTPLVGKAVGVGLIVLGLWVLAKGMSRAGIG